MIRNAFTVLLLVVAAVATARDAKAVWITSNSTVAADGVDENGVSSNPLLDIRRVFGGGGNIYTNDLGATGFAVGNEIRTVAGIRLTSMADGVAYDPVTVDGQRLIVVTAATGHIISNAGGIVKVLFDAASVWIIKDDAFNPANPATWNFAAADIVASYTLAAQENVIAGLDPLSTPFGGPFPNANLTQSGSTINVSGVNPTTGGNIGDSLFLLKEATKTDFFDVNTTGATGPVITEGMLANAQQTLERSNYADVPVSAASLAQMNAIAATAGFSDLDPGTPGIQGWASGVGPGNNGVAGAANSGWNPVFTGGVPTGDFRSGEQFTSYPAFQTAVVPEPGSMVLFGLGLVGLVAYRARRRK